MCPAVLDCSQLKIEDEGSREETENSSVDFPI